MEGSATAVLSLSLFLFQAVATAPAKAAPGDLDPTFGTGGKVLDKVAGGGDANAVAVQADGKVVTVGSTAPNGGGGNFLVARYNVDGSPDLSFGIDGKAKTPFWGAEDIAIQPDGKIVVVGAGEVSGSADFAVARYNTNGSLDATFSEDGTLTTDFGEQEYAKAVRIQPDGKIVVVGTTGPGPQAGGDYAVARYNADGTPDNTFGTEGRVVTDFGGEFDTAYAIAFDSSGNVLVGGAGDFAFGIARYTPTGALDTSFSGDGKQRTTFGASAFVYYLAVESTGTIVAAGRGSNDFALAHYTPSGDPDPSLAGVGKVSTAFGDENVWVGNVVAQADGKLVALGTAYTESSENYDFAVARYSADGSPDANFAGGALRVTDFGGQEWGAGLALAPDGSIVASGVGYNTGFEGDGWIAVSRYLGGEAVPDTTPPETTITDGPLGTISDPTPTFGFSSSEAGSRFQCRVDGGPFVSCTSPHTIDAVAEGSHTFEARAIDPSSNVDPTPASRSFTFKASDNSGSGDAGSGPSSTASSPSGPTKQPVGPMAGKAVAVKAAITQGNVVRVGLRCQVGAACRGVVKLLAEVQSRRSRRVEARAKKRSGTIVIGRSRFAVAPGRQATIRVRLNRKGKQLIRRSDKHGLKVRLTGRGIKPRVMRLKRKPGRRHKAKKQHRSARRLSSYRKPEVRMINPFYEGIAVVPPKIRYFDNTNNLPPIVHDLNWHSWGGPRAEAAGLNEKGIPVEVALSAERRCGLAKVRFYTRITVDGSTYPLQCKVRILSGENIGGLAENVDDFDEPISGISVPKGHLRSEAYVLRWSRFGRPTMTSRGVAPPWWTLPDFRWAPAKVVLSKLGYCRRRGAIAYLKVRLVIYGDGIEDRAGDRVQRHAKKLRSEVGKPGPRHVVQYNYRKWCKQGRAYPEEVWKEWR